MVGDPGLDLELWLFVPFDSLRADCLFVSLIESSFKDRRISSVMGRGSFVGEGSLCRKKDISQLRKMLVRVKMYA